MQKTFILFGDKRFSVPDVKKKGGLSTNDEPFATLKALSKIDAIVFPYQVHGVAGLWLNTAAAYSTQSFVHDADWLITNVTGVGLGILTADCMPILVYDPVARAVGAIHAGWRGAVDGVVVEALCGMRRTFGTHAADVQVWIGPHAGTCCYKVDQPFYDVVMQKQFGKTAWYQENGQLFFDLYACCLEQLNKVGVVLGNITPAHICTICTPAYCSYRREKEAAWRNISVIGLSSRLRIF